MRKWAPLIAVCLGTFMLLIDVTIVNVALPDLTRDLGAAFSQLQWVIDIYALALAALLLGAGSIADALGRKKVYLAGLITFALASLACGTAQNVEWLIIARGIQGVGGAAMFATTIALLNVSYQGADRGTAYGIWGAVSGAAAGAGVIAGGALTDLLSWHWVFFVNLPISVAAIALTAMVFTDGPRSPIRLDLGGMLAFTVAAGLITFAIIRAGEDGWTARGPVIAFGVGVIALAGFVLLQKHRAQPLIDLGLLRNRIFTGACLAALLLPLSAFGTLALVSIWLQSVLNLSPLAAGLALLPLSIVAFAVAALSGRFLRGVPPARSISGGLALIGIGSLLLNLIQADSSWRDLVLGTMVVGAGVGLSSPPLTSAALATVPLERSGMAAGIVNTARQLGLAFGVAIFGTLFTARATDVLQQQNVPRASELASAVSGGQRVNLLAQTPEAFRSQLDSAIHDAFAAGLHGAFVLAGVAGLIGAGLSFLLLRSAQTPVTRVSVSPASPASV
ncbi:MAG TPA: MFS transporter [Kineosporiaceae bacterium]|nr:MFS transporter [Kineosporiaceae bacterium]